MLTELAPGQHDPNYEQCCIEDCQRNGVFDNKRPYRIGDHIEEVVRIERQIREKEQDMVRNIVVQVGHHHRHDHDRSDDGKYPHTTAHPGREQQRNPKQTCFDVPAVRRTLEQLLEDAARYRASTASLRNRLPELGGTNRVIDSIAMNTNAQHSSEFSR